VGACAAALTLGACSSTPPEEDPVQIKLHDLDTRLARIERVMANQSLLELSNQLEALRADVRAMHNDVDQLTNSMESGRKQQRDLYADLDHRLKVLELHGGAGYTASNAGGAPNVSMAAAASSPLASGTAASGGSSDASASAADDKAAYQAAFGLMKEGKYESAVPAFQRFLAGYPDSPLADNAQYWLGEAYYVNKSYPEAELAFQHVIDKYPQSRKFADALLRIGFCRYELKEWDSARLVLSKVVTQYADTPDAQLAKSRLDKMAAENH
jgi:tol-pal system protein YbgF